MLGSRKLLIVLFIVPCVLSLVCIGAFAAPAEDFTPSVDIPVDTEVVEDVVKSPSAVAEETFPAQPLLTSSYYKIVLPFNRLPTTISGAPYCFGFSCYFNGHYMCGASDGDTHALSRGSSSEYFLTWNNTRYSTSIPFDGSSSDYITVEIISTAQSISVGGETFSGTLVENDLIPDIASSVFDTGDAVITFIMSSWLVMIPLAAWLVILCIGAIRKLVKGV